MRWIAMVVTLCALSGCRQLEVKQATFAVSINLNLPVQPAKP